MPTAPAKFSFDSFATEQETSVNILDVKGQPSGMTIRLAGPDSLVRKQTTARYEYLMATLMDPSTGDFKPEFSAEANDRIEAAKMDDMVAATLGWSFPEGTEGPEATPENIRDIYTRFPTVYRQAFRAANEVKRFMKA